MWDKLRIQERDRRLARLFVFVLLAVCLAGSFSLGFTFAAPAAGFFILGVFWVVATRRLAALRSGKWGSAPVGPLSPDERTKARSKLLSSRRPDLAMR